MKDIQGSEVEGIHEVDSLNELVSFMDGFGYTAKAESIYLPNLGLLESPQNLMRGAFLLAGYDRNFQVYLIKASSIPRTDFRTVLSLGGTLTGEHGIGAVKREYLKEFASPAILSLMRGIKQTFDPLGIMNPGKVL